MGHVFMEAIISIPEWSEAFEDFDYFVYKIKNLDSPSVQNLLQMVDEGDYMKIANLGLLLVRDISYTKVGGIVVTCKKVKKNGGEWEDE